MTDTGHVPGEGLPENARHRWNSRASPLPGAYTFLDPSENGADRPTICCLRLPGAQGACIDPQSAPAPASRRGPRRRPQPNGQDSDAYLRARDRRPRLPAPSHLGADVRRRGGAPSAHAARSTVGPQVPDASVGVVRSLADRGPAGTPVNPAPVLTQGPPTTGPEYLDVPREEPVAQVAGPQHGEFPPQSGMAWTPQQRTAPHESLNTPMPPAETVVPEPAAAESVARNRSPRRSSRSRRRFRPLSRRPPSTRPGPWHSRSRSPPCSWTSSSPSRPFRRRPSRRSSPDCRSRWASSCPSRARSRPAPTSRPHRCRPRPCRKRPFRRRPVRRRCRSLQPEPVAPVAQPVAPVAAQPEPAEPTAPIAVETVAAAAPAPEPVVAEQAPAAPVAAEPIAVGPVVAEPIVVEPAPAEPVGRGRAGRRGPAAGRRDPAARCRGPAARRRRPRRARSGRRARGPAGRRGAGPGDHARRRPRAAGRSRRAAGDRVRTRRRGTGSRRRRAGPGTRARARTAAGAAPAAEPAEEAVATAAPAEAPEAAAKSRSK